MKILDAVNEWQLILKGKNYYVRHTPCKSWLTWPQTEYGCSCKGFKKQRQRVHKQIHAKFTLLRGLK